MQDQPASHPTPPGARVRKLHAFLASPPVGIGAGLVLGLLPGIISAIPGLPLYYSFDLVLFGCPVWLLGLLPLSFLLWMRKARGFWVWLWVGLFFSVLLGYASCSAYCNHHTCLQ